MAANFHGCSTEKVTQKQIRVSLHVIPHRARHSTLKATGIAVTNPDGTTRFVPEAVLGPSCPVYTPQPTSSNEEHFYIFRSSLPRSTKWFIRSDQEITHCHIIQNFVAVLTECHQWGPVVNWMSPAVSCRKQNVTSGVLSWTECHQWGPVVNRTSPVESCLEQTECNIHCRLFSQNSTSQLPICLPFSRIQWENCVRIPPSSFSHDIFCPFHLSRLNDAKWLDRHKTWRW
jgi:hypothetical protein